MNYILYIEERGEKILNKRFISFILAIIILSTALPMPSFAKGQVMEIDALFGDLKLYLEDKPIPHKDVFIYDGELWIPVEDLAKALKIGYDFNSNKRTLKLNSHGKLNIKDSSIEPIAYQRGYEIQAMERRFAEIENEIREFEGRRTDIPSELKGIVKNIKVGFSDIDVFLDEKKIDLDKEPLLYNGDVYVSLVALSPLLYITPELKGNVVNIDGNSILVHKKGFYDVRDLAQFREDLNKKLNRHLEELEKKKKILMDVKIPYEEVNSLSDMERYLNKHLDHIEKLPVDISLRGGTDSWYYLDIVFKNRYDFRWRDLNRRDVEAYIWDIFVAINSLYDENAKIQGQIRDTRSGRYNYVEFDTYMGSIEFGFINSGLDKGEKIDPIYIEDLLQKKLPKFGRESFDYTAKISGYDLELVIIPSSGRFKNWSIHNKVDYLNRVGNLIKRDYPEIKVNGIIEYSSDYKAHFTIENGKLRSPELERETEEFLNKYYGLFTVNDLKVPMKYTLHQISIDDYKLLVDMDFDINNSGWNRTAEDKLGAFLQDVISEIIALWDMNIFLQAYDKNQNMVKEVIISQDIAQMVNANPVSGEIVEGSTVELYTNTEGASIYYTLDGTLPSEGNRISYTKPIIINSNTTIRAYATKTGMKDSPVSTFEYTVVDNTNMASGLDNLEIESERLEPRFDKKAFDYIVNVNYPVESINIIATAAVGSIEIDGDIVKSGESKKVSLEVGENKINIAHKEEGKKNRIYNVIVNRREEDAGEVWLDPKYTFNTSIIGVFSGKLESDTLGSFNGYKIRLVSNAGKVYEEKRVDANGSFKVTGFDVDLMAKLIGYKYEIIDPSGHTIGGGNL